VLLEHGKGADNISRLLKSIDHCEKVREYQKEELNDINKWFRVLVYSLKRSET